RGHEGGLAADPVAQVAEDNPAERPGDEPHREGQKGEDLAQGHRLLGEEERPKDQGRRRAVEEEVVPLDRRAHGAGDDRLHERSPLVFGFHRASRGPYWGNLPRSRKASWNSGPRRLSWASCRTAASA